MQTNKLKEIIARKNERLESDAVNEAEQHINHILKMQEVISEAQAEIKESQEALKKLEVKNVDAASVLGEESDICRSPFEASESRP